MLGQATAVSLGELVSWHPHADVWAIVGVLTVGYWYALRRLGPTSVRVGEPVVTTRQVVFWYSGVGLLWLVSGWPFHDIGERSLFSFHMTEHLVIAFGVAPLLLLGTPRWLARLLLDNDKVLAVVRELSRPLVAFFLFNGVLALIHVPAVVELMLSNAIAHFFIHSALFASALIMWMPVLSPLPEIPRLRAPVAMFYLFANSLIPIVPASFLTFTEVPLYAPYASAPRLWGIDPVTDQAVAGLIMKLGAGFLLWVVIAAIWFRWYHQEQEWDRIERQLREA